MSAEAVIQRAERLGVTLTVVEDRIRCSPKSAVPPDFIEVLRLHKSEVINHLRQHGADIAHLLAWASELSEKNITLDQPVSYLEAPLRTIAMAQNFQKSGSWKPWTPEWWQEQEREAFRALSALQEAVHAKDHQQPGARL